MHSYFEKLIGKFIVGFGLVLSAFSVAAEPVYIYSRSSLAGLQDADVFRSRDIGSLKAYLEQIVGRELDVREIPTMLNEEILNGYKQQVKTTAKESDPSPNCAC